MNIAALKKLCEFDGSIFAEAAEKAYDVDSVWYGARKQHAVTQPLLTQLCRVVEAAEKTIEYADDYGDSFISKPIREAIKELEKVVQG